MYERQLKKLSRTRLDDVLIDEGVLHRAHVEDAQAESEMTGRPLSHILFERQEMDEWDLAKIVARNYSLPFVDVVTYTTPREAEVLLDLAFCRQNLLLPFDLFGKAPAIAVCEMPSAAILDDIEARCGHLPFVYVTLRSRLLEALDAREASGVAPAGSAAAPVRATPASPAAAAAATAPSPPAGGIAPASMRLGFSMHARGAAPAASLPTPPRRAQPPKRRPAAPGDVVDTASQREPADAEPAEKSGKVAAWQSIFDLGDEAV